MTREEVKELLPIMQAYSEGKTIEFLSMSLTGAKWTETDDPDFILSSNRYRIKPESKYRPFKSKEECWSEMMKHHPFGWITGKTEHLSITSVSDVHILLGDNVYFTIEDAFNEYTFADGKPFGIKEE